VFQKTLGTISHVRRFTFYEYPEWILSVMGEFHQLTEADLRGTDLHTARDLRAVQVRRPVTSACE
jgi:hypothetical protein